MKKTLALFFAFMATTVSGYAQNSGLSQIHSKEQAIATLQAIRFIEMFRYEPQDVAANIDILINEIEKIVPVDAVKHTELRTQMLSAIEQRKFVSQRHPLFNKQHLIFWPWYGGEPIFIEQDINEVIGANFSSSDYQKLSAELSARLIQVIGAYEYLGRLRNKEVEGSWDAPLIAPAFPMRINIVYDYFDIH